MFYLSAFLDSECMIDDAVGCAHRPVGFDIEWRPNFRKNGIENPVALVQLADKARVLLIHVSVMGASPP
jgi:hypothetical protein